jgi:hypothetical protein
MTKESLPVAATGREETKLVPFAVTVWVVVYAFTASTAGLLYAVE